MWQFCNIRYVPVVFIVWINEDYYYYCYYYYDQFSFLGNRARDEFIELDMSTVLDLSIPSSRPLTFPGEQSKNSYRARWLIELGDLSSSVFQEKKKREKMEIKAIMTTWSTKSKTPSRSQFLTDKKHCVAGRLMNYLQTRRLCEQ